MRLPLDLPEEEGWTPDDWATPRPLVDALAREFGEWTLDPCCKPHTAKAPLFYTKQDDGLSKEWTGRVWCNPPYSDIPPWLQKARESADRGALVVCLIPAWTDRSWWPRLVTKAADEVRFLSPRVKFIGPQSSSPTFGCALIVYRPKEQAVA